MAKYTEVYSAKEIGVPELPSFLSELRKTLSLSEFDGLTERRNKAISAAENCKLTGLSGILDMYFDLSSYMEGLDSVTPEEETLLKEVWENLDKEVLLSLSSHCNCKLK